MAAHRINAASAIADTPRGARRFDYDLTFPTDSPTHRLRGTKLIEPRPGGGVWTDTSTLLVAITDLATERLLSRGVLRITADEYLSALIPSLRITGTSDPAQIIWGLTQFARFFLGSLQDVYAPALSRILERMRGATPRAPSYASEPSAPDAAVSRESGLG